MGRSLEALTVGFADEDTATWTAAAVELGARAVAEPEALAFVRHWLARSPEDAPEGEANIHRFRHACCALASYLSAPRADPEAVRDLLERHVLGPLVNLAFAGLRATKGTIGDLSRIPGLGERFTAWRDAQREGLVARLEKLEAAGNDRGVAANRAKLEALDALDAAAELPKGFDPDLPGLLPQTPWALASYFAGVRSAAALSGVPLDLLVRGALALGQQRKGAGLPFVLNLAPLLLAVKAETDAAQWDALVAEVAVTHHPAWVAERLHYNDWVRASAALPGAPSVLERLERDAPWSPALVQAVAALKDAPPAELPRHASRLMRDIAERAFADDWAWEEKTSGERFALNLFAMLAVHGPGPLVGRPDDSKIAPSVSHRVALVLEALQRGFRAREHVVPTLVRCLKLLLDQELRAHAGKRDLADVCRRQVALVRPLVAEWRLPRTLRKDLATIVCRVLLAAFRADRAAFVELLYHVLYALPDEVLFREIIEYSTEDEVSQLLHRVVDLVEAAHADADGAVLLPRYLAFAEKVGELAAASPRVAWTGHLPALVRFMGRVPDSEDARISRGPPLADLEVEGALQAILRCRGDLEADWSELSSARRSDRKGASWAAREASRTEGQRARRSFDRFSRLLDDVQVLESDCLPEVGRPRPTDDLVRRWRRLISTLDELSARSADNLPFLEREVVVALLEARIEHLERRLSGLVQVLEREDEAAAVGVLEARARQTSADDEGLAHDLVNEDARLVQEWMLGRYMIAELARVFELRVLALLTRPGVVFAWLLAPFVACAALHRAGLEAWLGVPFVATAILDVGLLVAYSLEARRPRGLAAGAGRYLLPQITAALFLGISEVLASDESWSLAVLEYGGVRLFTAGAFLAAGFFFIREVLLGGQLEGRAEARAKTRRAGSVMALVLWQSFALVTLFGAVGGRVMGARAGLEVDHLGVAFGLPHEARLEVLGATFRIFPWALVTWTVQVFFFSAIFERIMRSSD